MKELELRKYTQCANCRRLILSAGIPLFWIVKIERHGVLLDAVTRQGGLATFLGGNAQLAQVMGPDEEMTKPLLEVSIVICELCGSKPELHKMVQLAFDAAAASLVAKDGDSKEGVE